MADFISITSRDNSLIKLVCVLQNSSRERREKGLFVLEGLRLCTDAFENGIQFDKLIVTKEAMEKYSQGISSFSRISKACYVVPTSLFSKISDTSSPQGVIVLAKLPDSKEANVDKMGRYIVLENLNDPSNLGAVSRTAEALGVSGIILSKGSCDPYSPKALRSSMGTLLRMNLIITDDFPSFFKKNGLTAYACVVDSTAKPIKEISFGDGSAVIIGNEANGITEETRLSADECITIPMKGRAESLNAAVAASISMWEMMK